jgi:hypothetical protein
MLAFTSVYFLESGLINGLRPFGVKKFRCPQTPIFTSPDRTILPCSRSIWFGDKKQCKSHFGLMEEIVGIFGFAPRFRRIRRIGRPGRMEVVFEVFSSRHHGGRDGENVTEAQFAQWRRLDPCGPPKPPVAMAPAGAADRLANRLREPHGNLMAELASASTARSSGGL